MNARLINYCAWVDRKDRFVNFLNVETKENRFDEHVSRLPVYYVHEGWNRYILTPNLFLLTNLHVADHKLWKQCKHVADSDEIIVGQ